MLAGLLFHESAGFDPDVVAGKRDSPTGDVGIAQINLASHPTVTRAQASTPAFAIPWAAHYLATLKTHAGGSTTAALRAYNTGSTAPSSAGNRYASDVIAARGRLVTGLRQLAGYVAPVPGGKVIRLDQGIDYQGPVGGSVVAIGNGVVDAVKNDPGGFGRVVYYTLTDGPRKGQQVYVGHAAPNVTAGQRLTVGQRIATLLQSPLGNATQPGWTEVGFAAGGAPVSHSETDTSSSTEFASFTGGLSQLPGKVGGAIGGAAKDVGKLLPDVPDPFGLGDLAKTFSGIGEAGFRFAKDPAYPFLWLGFMVVGLALVFIGVERLLGRSAGSDARAAALAVPAARVPMVAP